MQGLPRRQNNQKTTTTVERVVAKAFGWPTVKIATVEASTMRNTRQLLEVRQELAQKSVEVVQLRHSVDGMTAELAQLRMQGMSQARVAQQATASTTAAPPSRSGAQSFDIHTPRADPMSEQAILIIWPRKMVSDRYKAFDPRIMAKYLSDVEADTVVPNYPQAANRTGAAFPTHDAAARFHAAFRAEPFN